MILMCFKCFNEVSKSAVPIRRSGSRCQILPDGLRPSGLARHQRSGHGAGDLVDAFDGAFALQVPVDSPHCEDARHHVAQLPDAVPSTKSWDAPVKSKGKEKSQGKTHAQISSNGPFATDTLLPTRCQNTIVIGLYSIKTAVDQHQPNKRVQQLENSDICCEEKAPLTGENQQQTCRDGQPEEYQSKPCFLSNCGFCWATSTQLITDSGTDHHPQATWDLITRCLCELVDG